MILSQGRSCPCIHAATSYSRLRVLLPLPLLLLLLLLAAMRLRISRFIGVSCAVGISQNAPELSIERL